jgi:outer membrane receptor for ferrienterochelin and colicin
MKRSLLPLFLTFAFLHPLTLAQHRSIQGRVVDQETKESLPYATVMVKGTRNSTHTNLEGFFFLQSVPDTAVTLQVSFIGYQTLEIVSDPKKPQSSLVLGLNQVSLEMKGVTVVGQQATFIKSEEIPGLTTISPQQLISLPSIGQADVFRSMQLLPGISGTDDGSSGLRIRGGTPDQNLVLFDGMTVYHVDHFFGFFSAFNPDAIKDLQIYKGGYPAVYGGRLSSIIDIVGRTGSSERFRGSAGFSILSANGSVEGPILGGTFLAAARRSLTDVMPSSLYNSIYKYLTGSDAPQAGGGSPSGFGPPGGGGMSSGFSLEETPKSAFSDINLKYSVNLSQADFIALSYYGSLDDYDLTRQQRSQNTGASFGSFSIPGRTNTTTQGNNGASLKWFRQWLPELHSDFLVAYAAYTSDFTSGASSSNTTGQQFSTNESNRITDFSLQMKNQYRVSTAHDLSFGGEMSLTGVRYNLSGSMTTGGNSQLLGMDDKGSQFSLYLQDSWNISDPLELTSGFRASMYSAKSTWTFEPRVSATYRLSPTFKLKGAFGTYHQYVNRIVNENVTEGSRDFWILANATLPGSGATHYIAGLSWEDEDILLDMEGYHKDLSNLIEFSQRFRRDANEIYNFFMGTGKIDGVDVLLQKKTGWLTGWISYTLSRSKKRFDAYNDGNYFPSEADQTHELKIVGSVQPGAHWNVSATGIYGTGKPYTAPVSQYSVVLLDSTTYSYTHVSEKNKYRLPAYFRVDLSVSKKLLLEKKMSLTLGLSVFNLTNHKNVSYYQYDLEQYPVIVSEITGLGVTPTVFIQFNF